MIGKISFLKTRVYIPVDSIISRIIEILISMPLLILIISISAIAKEKSMINLMVIIGLTTWTGIARLTRAEFLKISNLEYIQAAKSMGFKEFRIIFRHALPNGLAPALIAIAFGVASAILIESSLSFLGIGVPPTIVTWGSLLNSGWQQFSAWWLVIFPGLAIFITVTIYNLLGEGLRDALDPRLKR
jgi:peptide/nickel transport system permease protein